MAVVWCLSLAPAFSSRAAPTMKTLPGHVSSVVSGLTAQGLLSTTTNLNLAIGLPLRNREALTNLLRQIYDPASTNYHRYLTPAEFTAQFGPTEQDYQKVLVFAKQNGLIVNGTYSNRMLVDVRGTAGNIEKAFDVTLRVYKHPTENRDFFAPDRNPTVPAGLPVLDISGLNNYYIPHPNYKILSQDQTGGATPAAGTGPRGSYWGRDFRNAYVPGTTLTGAGQNVGLLQFDGFFPIDITNYENQVGITNPPQLVIVPVDGGVPAPNPSSPGVGEVSLDIEMVVSMSPGVSKIYVYEAPNPSPWVDLLNRMANDDVAKQLSCSWGGGPPNPVAEQIFQEMAFQGQTFFDASGDSDAFIGSIPFPADSPHITEVGGTTLTTGSGATYASETVWNWGNEFGPAYDGAGSSGGISPTYSIPSWQTNIDFRASQGSTTMRNVPDVALTADNVWVIYGGGQTGAFGGTSCAAPLWAGFTALVNQQAAFVGHAPVGFINPAIYAIAASTNYNADFHDVTTGDNTWSQSPNRFFAVRGYDLCTGLGTPNGTNLINALTAVGITNVVTHLSPPPPPYGDALSALKGGNPNGTWQLFIQDDSPPYSGVISNGWILTVTTASPVGSASDVALSMAASATNITLSNNVTFTLGVANYGPTTVSSNVIVSDNLPLGATLVTNYTTRGSVIRSGSTLVWSVGNLVTNAASAQLTIVLQPDTVGNLLNYALVSADTPDPNPDDNAANLTVAVAPVTPPQLAAGYISASRGFQLTVSGSSVQTVIEASTNLLDWAPIYTNTPPFVFTNLDTVSYPYRFFRAVQ